MKNTCRFTKGISKLPRFNLLSSKLSGENKFFNVSKKGFYQTNDLNDAFEVAEKELKQREAKFVEYTQKVYKPSKTITYDRNGELLLFSANNIKHSEIYFKYPYCLYDMAMPLCFYNFFVDPCKKTSIFSFF